MNIVWDVAIRFSHVHEVLTISVSGIPYPNPNPIPYPIGIFTYLHSRKCCSVSNYFKKCIPIFRAAMKHGIYTVHICIFINYKINDNLPPCSNDLSLIIAAKQKGAVQLGRFYLIYMHVFMLNYNDYGK